MLNGDRVGRIAHANGSLAFSYGLDGNAACTLPSPSIRVGEQVLLRTPDDGELPFRVVSMKALG